MKPFRRITIIGIGLIGGSVGLAIKKRRMANEVIGVFRRKSTLARALRHRAIDRGTMDMSDGVCGADLIIVASPVKSIPKLALQAARFAHKGAVITDVGSTKKWIVDSIEKAAAFRRGVLFVGSHPMAGSERAGVEFAKAGLLDGSPCIVTKTARTNQAAFGKVARFWKALGAKVRVMSPEAHDRSVALVSHLPHVVAFALAGAVPEVELGLAAEGFKDTTRVASSDPRLWADIFSTNTREIAKSCRTFDKFYKKVLKALASGRYAELAGLLKKAKDKRDRLIYGKR